MTPEERYAALEKELAGATIVQQKAPRHSITAPDSLNGRFTAGQRIAGIVLERDNRDIPGMVASIKARGGITEPLVVWENESGQLEVRRGFRRYNAANLICLTEMGSELAQTLAELPVLVYRGISREASLLLVNDQTSLSFSSSEIYSMFAREMKGGANWKILCRQWFPQMGRISGSPDKVNEVLREPDQDKRNKLVDDWMNNFGNQFWGNSVKAGHYVENIVLQGYMEDDQLLKPTVPARQRISSKSMKSVWRAYQQDNAEGQYDPAKGYGPKMLEAIAEANKPKAATTVKKDRKSSEALEMLIQLNSANGRKLVPAILRMAFVEGNAATEVAIVNMFEDNAKLFGEHSQFLKTDIGEMLRLAFFGPSEKFSEFLVSSYAEPRTVEPRTAEIETPQTAIATTETAPEVKAETAPTETAPEVKAETAPETPTKPEPRKRSK